MQGYVKQTLVCAGLDQTQNDKLRISLKYWYIQCYIKLTLVCAELDQTYTGICGVKPNKPLECEGLDQTNRLDIANPCM
jgi:hypothetical protein